MIITWLLVAGAIIELITLGVVLYWPQLHHNIQRLSTALHTTCGETLARLAHQHRPGLLFTHQSGPGHGSGRHPTKGDGPSSPPIRSAPVQPEGRPHDDTPSTAVSRCNNLAPPAPCTTPGGKLGAPVPPGNTG